MFDDELESRSREIQLRRERAERELQEARERLRLRHNSTGSVSSASCDSTPHPHLTSWYYLVSNKPRLRFLNGCVVLFNWSSASCSLLWAVLLYPCIYQVHQQHRVGCDAFLLDMPVLCIFFFFFLELFIRLASRMVYFVTLESIAVCSCWSL